MLAIRVCEETTSSDLCLYGMQISKSLSRALSRAPEGAEAVCVGPRSLTHVVVCSQWACVRGRCHRVPTGSCAPGLRCGYVHVFVAVPSPGRSTTCPHPVALRSRRPLPAARSCRTVGLPTSAGAFGVTPSPGSFHTAPHAVFLKASTALNS